MIKVFNSEVVVNHFPDGTQNIKVDQDFHTSFINVFWKYENDAEMATLMYIKKHLEKKYKLINLIMPYIPNARMDRVKNDNEVFSLKYFAEFINLLKFDMVKVFDPHSTVSEALIDNIITISPEKLIQSAISSTEVDSLFFPDEGAMKRYSNMATLPYTFGVKKRQWETGEILGLDIAGDIKLIKDKNILIVDDICSRGGTFYFAAKKLKELGAKDIHLCVSHCENTIYDGNLLDGELINKIWTTDSLKRESHPKINVMPIEEVM